MKTKKWKKLLASMLMSVIMLEGTLATTVNAVELETVQEEVTAYGTTSGTIGTNGTWELDDSGTLIVSYNGKIDSSYWSTLDKSKVRKAVICVGATNLSERMFADFINLESIEIPTGVIELGKWCFDNCQSLKKIKIPKGVTEIKEYTFFRCSSLENIELPEGLKSVDGISNCDSLESIELPKGLESIAGFNGCKKLKCIEIPKSVSSIKDGTFYASNNLKSIEVEAGNAFYYSEKGILYCAKDDERTLVRVPCGAELEVFQIPDNVTKIEPSAVARCDNLKEVVIPASIKSIGESAFSFCSNLKKVELPDSMTFLGTAMFEGCSSIKTINLPKNLKSIHVCALAKCSSLEELNIPEGVSTIWDGAFDNCSNLKRIKIPESVSYIDESAFNRCNKLVIECYKDSEAYRIAVACSIPYKLLSKNVAVTSITLNKSKAELKRKKTLQLKATIAPDNATNKKITWTSSNEKVATVNSSGKVTAKNYGTATITAVSKANSKIKATCKITVPYTIKYKLIGGTNNSKNPSTYYNKKISLKNPTRKGYVFKGWYTDSKYKNKISTIAKGTKKNYTLYAKWQKVTVSKTSITSAKNSKSKQILLKYKKMSGVKGYEIAYTTDKNFKKSVTKKNTTKTSYTIKNLKKKKTYYIKVRAYKLDSTGKKVYGKYTTVKKIVVKK